MFGRKSRFLGVGAECSPNPGVANRSICKLQRNHSQLRRFSEEEERAKKVLIKLLNSDRLDMFTLSTEKTPPKSEPIADLNPQLQGPA